LQKISKIVLPNALTKLQRELVAGSMLGDGSIYQRKPTHLPYFVIQRVLTDKKYNSWQAKQMQPFICKTTDGSTFDLRTNKTYYWTKFTTRRCKAFVRPYDEWYSSGHKKVPRDLHLTPLNLAIWIADDGYVRACNSPWRLQIKLSTHGFDLEDTEFLCSLLCERYNEYFGITIDKGKGIIYGSDTACRALLNEVDAAWTFPMDRKTYWRRPEARFFVNQPKPSNPNLGRSKRKSNNGKRHDKVD